MRGSCATKCLQSLSTPKYVSLRREQLVITLYELIIGHINAPIVTILLQYSYSNPTPRSIFLHNSTTIKLVYNDHIRAYLGEAFDTEPNPLLLAVVKGKPEHLAVILDRCPRLLDLPKLREIMRDMQDEINVRIPPSNNDTR